MSGSQDKAEKLANPVFHSDDNQIGNPERLHSRRNFLKTSGLLAASSTAAAGIVRSANAVQSAKTTLALPKEFAALFCCPGNYTVAHALADIGFVLWPKMTSSASAAFPRYATYIRTSSM